MTGSPVGGKNVVRTSASTMKRPTAGTLPGGKPAHNGKPQPGPFKKHLPTYKEKPQAEEKHGSTSKNGGGSKSPTTQGTGRTTAAVESLCSNCNAPGHYARLCPKPTHCTKCDKDGHRAKDCTRDEAERKCHNCGGTGHLAKVCPVRQGVHEKRPWGAELDEDHVIIPAHVFRIDQVHVCSDKCKCKLPSHLHPVLLPLTGASKRIQQAMKKAGLKVSKPIEKPRRQHYMLCLGSGPACNCDLEKTMPYGGHGHEKEEEVEEEEEEIPDIRITDVVSMNKTGLEKVRKEQLDAKHIEQIKVLLKWGEDRERSRLAATLALTTPTDRKSVV